MTAQGAGISAAFRSDSRETLPDDASVVAAARADADATLGEVHRQAMVNYGRLKSLRSQTREAIDKGLAVEAALTRAIEAMEATQ